MVSNMLDLSFLRLRSQKRNKNTNTFLVHIKLFQAPLLNQRLFLRMFSTAFDIHRNFICKSFDKSGHP